MRKMPHSTNRKHTKSGFTIVEISIATAFISILMIVISVIIISVVGIYQKGNIIKTLNSVGRNLVDDIDQSIEAASPARVISDTASTPDQDKWSKGFYRSSNTDGTGTGVFCSGQYSYIWADQDHSIAFIYTGGSWPNEIRLLKVKDPNRKICFGYDGSNQVSVSKSYPASDIEELLASNDADLYIHSFYVHPVDGSSDGAYVNQFKGNPGEVFFSGYFELGTKRGEKGQSDADASLSNCKADDEDYNYCAINKFKFAARTAGKVY